MGIVFAFVLRPSLQPPSCHCWALRSQTNWFQSRLCHLPTPEPWISHLPSLCLSSLICMMESEQPAQRVVRRMVSVPSPAQCFWTTVTPQRSSSMRAASWRCEGNQRAESPSPPPPEFLALNLLQSSGSESASAHCHHQASLEAGRVFVAGQTADRTTGCLTERKTKLVEHLQGTMSVQAPRSLLTQPVDRTKSIVSHDKEHHHFQSFGRVSGWEERSAFVKNWKFVLRHLAA